MSGGGADSEVPCLGVGPGLRVSSNASWIMVTWDPPPNIMTDMTENITFPQLRWRAVNIQSMLLKNYFPSAVPIIDLNCAHISIM